MLSSCWTSCVRTVAFCAAAEPARAARAASRAKRIMAVLVVDGDGAKGTRRNDLGERAGDANTEAGAVYILGRVGLRSKEMHRSIRVPSEG